MLFFVSRSWRGMSLSMFDWQHLKDWAPAVEPKTKALFAEIVQYRRNEDAVIFYLHRTKQ